ncbi:MAG: 50S ribosomal protein L22 [Deltaproteobacteria bacterium]|nr:50S ribosomal protein L22 [Deltaproteobacteria bacterium]
MAETKTGTQASMRFLRIAPRKIRLVAEMVRGKNVEEALNILRFTRKRSARHLTKLIKSAVANADQKGGVNVDRLYVGRLLVDGGPTLKRWRPRAMGRATPVRRRVSHITVVLEQRS